MKFIYKGHKIIVHWNMWKLKGNLIIYTGLVYLLLSLFMRNHLVQKGQSVTHECKFKEGRRDWLVCLQTKSVTHTECKLAINLHNQLFEGIPSPFCLHHHRTGVNRPKMLGSKIIRYTAAFLHQLEMASLQTENYGNFSLRQQTRANIIDLGIRRQPTNKVDRRSKGGKKLFHKITSIINNEHFNHYTRRQEQANLENIREIKLHQLKSYTTSIIICKCKIHM